MPQEEVQGCTTGVCSVQDKTETGQAQTYMVHTLNLKSTIPGSTEYSHRPTSLTVDNTDCSHIELICWYVLYDCSQSLRL